MEALQALQLIDQALASVEANRSTHTQLQRAYGIVAEIVTEHLRSSQKDDTDEQISV